MQMEQMALGQGGLSDEPMWDGRIAEVRALRPAIIRLFIQEYFRLLPERGKYQFDTLDRSVSTILRTGAKPLMCICFKPRVLFPQVDQTVVEPEDYGEWEQLIEALVAHYRERGAGIRYWEVANEPDIGEDGGCPYLFQPESYGRYYAHTAAAVLRADPQARVGGPALAGVRSPILPALLEACEREGLPLHFVSWHIYNSDPAAVRETITYAKELLAQHPGLRPETFLDEWNMDLTNPPPDPRFQPCYVLETVWQMKEAGLDWSCYYHIRDYQVDRDQMSEFMSPKGAAFMARWWNNMPQFDGLFDYTNQVRPAYYAFKLLARLQGERLRVTSSDPAVNGFGARDEAGRLETVLLWNFSPEPVHVDLTLEELPADSRMRHVTLDALSARSDENARLCPDPYERLVAGTHRLLVALDPYGIQFWSFE